MHKLSRGVKNSFSSDEETSKSKSSLYLYDYQFDFLDMVAEKQSKSRNQVVREILDNFIGGTK